MNTFAAGMPCNARAARFKRLVPHQATVTGTAQCKKPFFQRYHHRGAGLPYQSLVCRASQQEPDRAAAQGDSDWPSTKSLGSVGIIGRTAIAAAVVFGMLLLPVHASELRGTFEKHASATESATPSGAAAQPPARAAVVTYAPADNHNAAQSGSATSYSSWSPLAVLDTFLTPTGDHPIWPSRAFKPLAALAAQEQPLPAAGDGTLVAALTRAQEGVAVLQAEVEGAAATTSMPKLLAQLEASRVQSREVQEELLFWVKLQECSEPEPAKVSKMYAAWNQLYDAEKLANRAMEARTSGGGALKAVADDVASVVAKVVEEMRLLNTPVLDQPQGRVKDGAEATAVVRKLLERLEASQVQSREMQEEMLFWISLQECSAPGSAKVSKMYASWYQLNNAEALATRATKRVQERGATAAPETAAAAEAAESTVATAMEEAKRLHFLELERPQGQATEVAAATDVRKLLAQLEASRARSVEVQEELRFWLKLYESSEAQQQKVNKVWAVWNQLYNAEKLATRATTRAQKRGAAAAAETAVAAEAVAATVAKGVEEAKLLGLSIS